MFHQTVIKILLKRKSKMLLWALFVFIMQMFLKIYPRRNLKLL